MILFHKHFVVERIFTLPAFVYLGRISYGLYVFHIFSIALWAFVFEHRFDTLQSLAALLTTIALAHISYSLIERRFLKLKRRYTIVGNKPVD